MNLQNIKTVTTINGSTFVDEFLKAGWVIVAVEHKKRAIPGEQEMYEVEAHFSLGAESADAKWPKSYEKFVEALTKAAKRH